MGGIVIDDKTQLIGIAMAFTLTTAFLLKWLWEFAVDRYSGWLERKTLERQRQQHYYYQDGPPPVEPDPYEPEVLQQHQMPTRSRTAANRQGYTRP